MLDLHVHVLPGIDDGPRNLDDALKLARALVADGIEHVVATPHIYPGVFDNTPHRIAEAFERLQTAVTAEGLALTMTWAAEVRICPEIIEWLEHRRLPLLDGSLVGPSTALIELPDGQIPVGTDRLAGLMLERGITPLIAHPERNKAVMEQPSRLEALRRMGCRFQLTAGSVIGEFGSKAHATARHLLDAGWADVVASDAHNLSGRKPRMSAARQWLQEHYDAALAERLMVLTPQQIAGVSSFALGAGEQKLVFRDLPRHADAEDSTWRSGLDQLDELPALQASAVNRSFGLKEAATGRADTGETPTPGWSLTDFRIDTVVDGLNEASVQAGATSLGDSVFGSQPPSAPFPAADPSASSEDDWHLPDFGMKPASRPPSRPAAPAPAPTPVQAPAPMAEPLVWPRATAQPLQPEPEPARTSAAVLLEELPEPEPRPEPAPAAPTSGATLMQSLWSRLKPASAPTAPTAAPEPAPVPASAPVVVEPQPAAAAASAAEVTVAPVALPVLRPAPAPVSSRPAAPAPASPAPVRAEPAAVATGSSTSSANGLRGLKLSDLEPLAPVAMPPRARAPAAATPPAPASSSFKPEAATDRAGTARRGMATAAFQSTRSAPLPSMPEVSAPPDPVMPAPTADGSRRGFRLRDLPFLSGARR
ncbi:MAG: tyrosine-protein phosphatase [Sphaerotilus sulfidivorans]|uniref:tyrosine-protein phosphatase n=1 Tax=Sphaerotilus sulfidivorans TaxID=639200 RepID=UPI003F2C1A9E